MFFLSTLILLRKIINRLTLQGTRQFLLHIFIFRHKEYYIQNTFFMFSQN